MYISMRVGRMRIGGGCLFWLTFGPVWLACVLMFGSIVVMAHAMTGAVRYILRRSAGHLTARQAP